MKKERVQKALSDFPSYCLYTRAVVQAVKIAWQKRPGAFLPLSSRFSSFLPSLRLERTYVKRGEKEF